MQQKVEQVSLLNQTCSLHTSEQLNLVCLSASCLSQGFICKLCRKLHENHNVIAAEEFLEILKRLVNYDGKYKTPNQIDPIIARTTASLMAIIEELEIQIEYFNEKLNQIKSQFEKYKQVSNDVCLLNNLIYYAYGTDSQQSLFQEQLQGVLKRMCFHSKKLSLISVASCQSNFLFVPNQKLYQNFLEPILNQLKQIRQSLDTKMMQPESYNVLNLQFKNSLDLIPNTQYNQIVFESETLTEEDKIFEKFIIDRPDNNPIKKIKKYKQEYNPIEEPCNQGIGRVEKISIVAGHKMWYHDLAFVRFKPRNWVVEPRHACIICKCHPKFARIKEFLNCKYGDLYGPIELASNLFDAFKKAVANRKEKQYLVERSGIYFHDLCVYWSSEVQCDEVEGKIDFLSLCKAVGNSYNTFCYLCKRRGATMKCNNPQCEIWIHYYCWKELDPSNQYLDNKRFRMLCPQHALGQDYKPEWLYSNQIAQSISNFYAQSKQKPQDQIKITHKEQYEEDKSDAEQQVINSYKSKPIIKEQSIKSEQNFFIPDPNEQDSIL
ncbi:unnamed protein product [Paramecium sonneborni]|uniref:Zinc finger PHD-type domain-containing protein n=1 Tax=Paramecium sonneborni TaxID=65129 RepID=A0A8S1M4A8_9CILI|nr:unnamed protein product [Paramecium sonneborni]